MPTDSADYFADARRAVASTDLKGFTKAIEAEKTEDPIRAREIAEFSILTLFAMAWKRSKTAQSMLEKAIDVLTDVTPVVIFDDFEKDRTLRALNIAEAACDWEINDLYGNKVELAKGLVTSTPREIAYSDAVRAGVLLDVERPVRRLNPVLAR